MAIVCRLIRSCYAGPAGAEVSIDNEDEFNYLRVNGYAALVRYETAARVVPVRRQRGRPKK